MKGMDFVFHLAAMVSVQGSVQKPNEYAQTNTRGTAIVAARYCEQQLSFQERHSRHLQSRHL